MDFTQTDTFASGCSTEVSIPPQIADLCRQAAELKREDKVSFLQQLLGRDACRRLGIYPVPQDFLLSVVIPVYNELNTLENLVERVRAVPLRKEIVLIDDASTDGTSELIDRLEKAEDVRVFRHEVNQGKGAAIRKGFIESRGDAVIIQDADLEYDPAEFPALLQPIVEGDADVVFGSRFIGETHRVLYFWHYLGNQFLTYLSNAFTNLNLTDMETCYKVFKGSLIRELAPALKEDRFGIEPELTAKVAKIPGVRIFERPITYSGRTYEQGKKITWRDGFRALYCIVKYR